MRTIFTRLTIFFLAINVAVSCSEQNQSEPETNRSPESTASNEARDKSSNEVDDRETINKKFDGLLSEVVAGADKGSIRPNNQLDSRLLYKEGRIAVEVTFGDKEVTPESISHFKQLGGLVDAVFLNKLYGWIPTASLRAAAKPKAVWMIAAATQVAYPINEEKISDYVNGFGDPKTDDEKSDSQSKEKENAE